MMRNYFFRTLPCLRFLSLFFVVMRMGCNQGVAQTKAIDSIIRLVIIDREDTTKVNHLNDLSKEFNSEQLYDSAIVHTEISAQLAREIKFDRGLGEAYFIKATAYRLLDDYMNSQENYLLALNIFTQLDDKRKIAGALSQLGTMNMYLGNYSVALSYYFKALKVNEAAGDNDNVVSNLGNIGTIYSDEQKFDKALEYYLKALAICKKSGNQRMLATSLGNIGIVYKEKREYAKALDYYNQAVKICEDLGNKNHLAAWYGNIANVYDEQGLTGKALTYYLKALDMAKQAGNKKRITLWLGNIGSFYCEQKKYKESFNYLFEALALSKSLGALTEQKYQYEMISNLYEKSTVSLPDSIDGQLLNPEQMRMRALHYYKLSTTLHDSIFSEESKKEIEQKEMNFNFEKKEAAIQASHDKESVIAAAESKKQKVIIAFVIGGLLVALALVFIVLRSLKTTRRQKSVIEKQKEIVDSKNRELALQKEMLEEKQKEILDSIYYARRIQQSLMTSEKYVARTLERLKG
jgi:tetratricopeptide (TPR) repeat protein